MTVYYIDRFPLKSDVVYFPGLKLNFLRYCIHTHGMHNKFNVINGMTPKYVSFCFLYHEIKNNNYKFVSQEEIYFHTRNVRSNRFIYSQLSCGTIDQSILRVAQVQFYFESIIRIFLE
jgi:hypothetical protein